MTGRPAIAVRTLTVKRGGRMVLDSVSLSVAAGEVVALVGPNGAGKSTLISAISGDVKRFGGEIELQGESIRDRNFAAMARLRTVYTAGRVSPPGFTAREVVTMGRTAVASSTPEEDASVVAESMGLTETLAIANREFTSLSEGERARVALARTFAQDAPMLLLDEPTASLDVRHQHLVMYHVRGFAERGRSVIVAVHDLNLACMYADRIAMIRGGLIVVDGTPADIVTPRNLEDVFNCPMEVLPHPSRPIPVVLPLVDPNTAHEFFGDRERRT